MLNDQYEPDHEREAPPVERLRWHKDIVLFGCEDVDMVYEYLVEKGLSIKPPIVTSYGMKQLNLSDPDGYHICFQHKAR